MLTIRKDQMRAFDAYTRQNFEERLVRHLKAILPQQVRTLAGTTPGDAKLRALIVQGIQKSAGYGITTERDTGRFIELMVRIAPDFERQPNCQWADAILKDQSLSGSGKVGLLHAQFAARSPATDTVNGDGASI
jgi:hypothetical protein